MRTGPIVRGSAAALLLLSFQARAVAQCDCQSPSSTPCTGQATNVRAVHYSGQTFITWDEVPGETNESYFIYRSASPIQSSSDLATLAPIYRVWHDSAEFYADRVYSDSPCDPAPFTPRYLERYWVPCDAPASCSCSIVDDADVREVPPGEGVLVWTIRDTDPHCNGLAWYAVRKVDSGETEPLDPCSTQTLLAEVQCVDPGPGGNVACVNERPGGFVEDPLPLEIPIDCVANPPTAGKYKRHVYVQYMDLRDWNPTFHAPNPLNCYWGEDPTEERIQNSLQYAYTYVVVEPIDCDNTTSPEWPVVMDVHEHGGSRVQYDHRYKKAAGCAVRINPIDPMDTWWFGFADGCSVGGAQVHDYRATYPGGTPTCAANCERYRQNGSGVNLLDVPDSASTNRIVNYTEFRLLRMIDDLKRMPPKDNENHEVRIDIDRVYVRGTSMGGSGSLALAMRYPDVFAAAACDKPMTDYAAYVTGPEPDADYRNEVLVRWGHPNDPLPVRLIAPEGMGVHLDAYQGESVWDWQNLRDQDSISGRALDDMVPFGVISGACDMTLPYPTQGFDFHPEFAEQKRTWGGKINCFGHGREIKDALPPGLESQPVLDFATDPMFEDWTVDRSDTVPGFSDLQPPVPDPLPTDVDCASQECEPASYYHNLSWVSSWNDLGIGGYTAPTECQWEITLVLVDPPPCVPNDPFPPLCPVTTVDVTPRKVGAFQICPGVTYTWRNEPVGVVPPVAIQSGTASVGIDGLLTVDDFMVSTNGNRLVIENPGVPACDCP